MKKLLPALLALVCLTAPGTSATRAAAADSLPPFGPEKSIPTPKIDKTKLANGMEIWVIPRDGLPRVDFVLAVRDAGFSSDDANAAGTASFIASLMTDGTAKYDSRTIAEMAQSYGGSINATASNDGIILSANALAPYAGSMAYLLAEVARQPIYPDAEVALAKINALQALKSSEARSQFVAQRAITRTMFKGHPYGNSFPTIESINGVSAAGLRAEYAKRIRPGRALLVITGRITAKDAQIWAKAAFSGWTAPGPAKAAPTTSVIGAKPSRILIDRPGSVQSSIRFGGPGIAASHPDYVPLNLAGTILGGGFSSRVNLNLREAKGYTYGASAGTVEFRDAGWVNGGSDVRTAVTGAAISEFFKEYQRLGTELVPAAEFTLQKRYIAGIFALNNQRQSSVASNLANNWLVGLPDDFFFTYVPRIQNVTAEQVRDMGRKYFSSDLQTIVVVGDKAQVADQLAPFGDFNAGEK
jgi:zinc protease